MLDALALQSMRPLFITPCYGAMVTSAFTTSLLALNNALWQVGMNAQIQLNPGDSLVTRARNNSVVQFLAAPEFTHLFWIDADVGFTPDAVFRLLLADRDVVAGAYPIKRINWPEQMPHGMSSTDFINAHTAFPVNAAHGNQSMALHIDGDGFLEVSEAPTGFMAIKREVLTTMMTRLPELKYTPDGPPDRPHRDLFYRFFDVMIEPETNRYLSEDYAFCRRWRDLGGKVYVDTTSKLQHQGPYTYSGDFQETLRLNPQMACGGV